MRFKKGNTPWNKGVKGIHVSPKTEFKAGEVSNEKHPQWKGDDASYYAKHMWVARHFGKPMECEHCYNLDAKKYEWANISGNHLRERSDWRRLCVQCHRIFDGHDMKMWETRRSKCV